MTALPACPYGSRCYRRNPAHFNEFAHPNSSNTIEVDLTDISDAATSRQQDGRVVESREAAIETEWLTPRSSASGNGDKTDEKEDLVWSPEQLQVFKNVIEKKKNVFITGGAGTGKTAVLECLRRKMPLRSTFFTASTGVAAVLISGTTLHRFAGIGKAEGTAKELAERVRRSPAMMNWQRCDALVIDEISMVDARLLDLLDELARLIKKVEKPFGGIQLVACGDFFQLPPVGKATNYAFQAKCWNALFPSRKDNSVVLRQVFRQGGDNRFAALLEEVRHGRRPYTVNQLLQSRVLTQDSEAERAWTSQIARDGIEPTILFSHNHDVDALNEKRLEALSANRVQGFAYPASDKGPKDTIENFFDRSGAGPVARLKVCIGAQVVLCFNVDVQCGLANGCRGVVTGFSSETNRDSSGRKQPPYPIVRFSNELEVVIGPQTFRMTSGDQELCSRKQIPLRLAWALTVHKGQGQTLSRCEVSLSRCFAPGQAYVALSRVGKLSSLRITEAFEPSACILADDRVIAFYQLLESDSPPMVLEDTRLWSASESGFWRCERAKSGRAKCRACQEAIALDEIRVGLTFAGFEQRVSVSWYHLNCARTAKIDPLVPKLQSTLQLGLDFANLESADQDLLVSALGLVVQASSQEEVFSSAPDILEEGPSSRIIDLCDDFEEPFQPRQDDSSAAATESTAEWPPTSATAKRPRVIEGSELNAWDSVKQWDSLRKKPDLDVELKAPALKRFRAKHGAEAPPPSRTVQQSLFQEFLKGYGSSSASKNAPTDPIVLDDD